MELSKLTVDHVLRLSAITAAQPTVVAANQRLLTLFATLPTPDDEDDPNFRFDLQSAGDTLYLIEANIAGWIQLTFAYPTETALARCILDAFRMLDAETPRGSRGSRRQAPVRRRPRRLHRRAVDPGRRAGGLHRADRRQGPQRPRGGAELPQQLAARLSTLIPAGAPISCGLEELSSKTKTPVAREGSGRGVRRAAVPNRSRPLPRTAWRCSRRWPARPTGGGPARPPGGADVPARTPDVILRHGWPEFSRCLATGLGGV
ncbi:hypothetical protein [Kitasatospora kifunensis]|uniref:Uncharacterized protein n=1 Tax=Kitasatospora kifunensis TaxID=58351 RepID=A0A7W7VZ16_KITKI|nr:hypothetical protein [Kitasatospora kifunensis]MBB4928317.1 hypothetical protein [Kitasatospora kifunensis]